MKRKAGRRGESEKARLAGTAAQRGKARGTNRTEVRMRSSRRQTARQKKESQWHRAKIGPRGILKLFRFVSR